MKHFLLTSIIAVMAYSQTGVKPSQLVCTVPSGSPFGLLGFLPPGTSSARQTCFTLDPASFVLDTTQNPPVLRLVISPATGTAVDGETPSGVIDGKNKTFVLAFVPIAGTVKVYWNGLRLKSGADYLIAGSTITFLTATFPADATDLLQADYRHL